MTAPVVVRGDARALPLPDCSVDAVVCDPPYELSFMGRSWDSTGVAFDTEPWREALRVLKPGGHLAAFGATRTYHRLGCAIEDAGFEVRDSIRAGVYAWVHGQGFPKSLDVGKAIDKARDDRADISHIQGYLDDARRSAGVSLAAINHAFGFAANGSNQAGDWITNPRSRAVPTVEQWEKLRGLLDFDDAMDAEVARLNERKGTWGHERPDRVTTSFDRDVYSSAQDVKHAGVPILEAARTWDGWGTALKPAWEPVVVARKPLDGTVAASVLAHGTGAINIDACRVAPSDEVAYRAKCASVVGLDSNRTGDSYGAWTGARADSASDAGRFPSNLLISHHPDCGDGCHELCHVRALDEQSGTRTSGTTKASHADSDGGRSGGIMGAHTARQRTRDWAGDTGGASRYYPTFRYEPKAPTWQRPQVDGRGFETVKPLDLMRWLVRLLTPPGGLVLDMFPGTGTTGQASALEGFRSLLVELEAAHIPFIRERLAQQVVVDRKTDEAVPVTPPPDDALSLFDLEAS